MGGSHRRETAAGRTRARIEEKKARRAALETAREHVLARAHPRVDHLPTGPASGQALPGITATRPSEIPIRGWRQILLRAWAEHRADNLPVIAGGVAFFGFLAIFPALLALISLYGLVASPRTITRQVESYAGGLPESARTFLVEQLKAITESRGGALTVGLVVSIVAAIWSASRGVRHMIAAVNAAYDEVETRGFLRLRLRALVLTFGSIVFILLAVGLIAVVPVVLHALPLGMAGTVLVQVIRWALLLAMMAGSLAVLYRVAPDRDAPKLRWVTLGSVVVTVVWALANLAFSFYVDNFGNYERTYGTLAGVIVLLLWLYLTCYLILLGAEINAEAEHQTARDTTEGPPMPMGLRGAVVADTLPHPPEGAQEAGG